MILNSIKREVNKKHTTYQADEILAGIAAKEPGVFAYLAQRYTARIESHVCRNSGNREEAAEVIQMTFLRLWMAVRDGRYTEEGKLDKYVYQLAANVWYEELRRRKQSTAVDIEEVAYGLADESEEDLVRAVVKDKQLTAMHQALQLLGDPCRQLIQWFHLEQQSLQDIALRLSYEYNALRKRIFDCRKKLKKEVLYLMQTDTNDYGHQQ